MSAFVIAFEIGEHGDAAARRASLLDKISTEAIGPCWNGEHVVVMNSEKATADLAYFLFHGTSLDRYRDQLLVFSMQRGDFAGHGRLADRRALRTLLIPDDVVSSPLEPASHMTNSRP